MYRTGDNRTFTTMDEANRHCETVFQVSGIVLDLRKTKVIYNVIHEFDGDVQAVYSFYTLMKADELFERIKTEDGFIEVFIDHPDTLLNETLRYAAQGDDATLRLITSNIRDEE